MIRKALIAVGGLTLLTMFCGREVASYVSTSCGWIKDSVKNAVPIEFEIERARQMVKKLVPDIRRNMHVIAQEEVEVEQLTKQIEDATARLEKDHNALMRMKSDVLSNKSEVQYNGRSYTLQQVKLDMANRFERYKTHDATLASLREILSARQHSLEAARQKLDGMLAARRQLEVDVENLEARFKMVEVAQTTSNYNFDDSQLGRVRGLISDLRTRLNVAEKMVNVENELEPEIPVATPAADDVIERMTEYFADDATKIADANGTPHVSSQEK